MGENVYKTFMCIVDVEIKKTTLGTTKKGGFYFDLCFLTATTIMMMIWCKMMDLGLYPALKNTNTIRQKKTKSRTRDAHIVYITAI